MNTEQYLKRINFLEKPKIELDTFIKLHYCHLTNIPFENLDIQNQTEIRLEKKQLFKKIVKNLRGGFCYELNYLFQFLLVRLGFDIRIISAQIFDGEKIGPEFDHLALIVKINGKDWLADVGFGDLFRKPLNIEHNEPQYDGVHYFKIEKWNENQFILFMSKNGTDFERKYLFRTDEKQIDQFSEQCQYKQQSKLSYFVKNKIVSLPIFEGRKTIFNSKYIVKNKGSKSEEFIIENKIEEKRILKKEFNITI